MGLRRPRPDYKAGVQWVPSVTDLCEHRCRHRLLEPVFIIEQASAGVYLRTHVDSGEAIILVSGTKPRLEPAD